MGNMLSLGTDFIPGIGELKMVLERAGGQDLITGRHLSPEEQSMMLSAVGAVHSWRYL